MAKPPVALDFMLLFANSVHDIKNSLNLLLQGLHGVAAQLDDTNSAQSLRALTQHGHHISEELTRLLTLYRLNQVGHYPLDVREHWLSEFLAEHTLLLQQRCQAQAVSLRIVCPEDLQGFFDGQLVATVIADAVHNALRGCRQEIVITAAAWQRGVLICVEDDGAGYPNEILAIQGQQSVPSQHGSGLGLFFAATVAQLHRNREAVGALVLDNHSQLGGARLQLFLP